MSRRVVTSGGARAGAVYAAPISTDGIPSVVLVGRANAGKSTLFNRIAKGARAIISPVPGTTRDLNLARTSSGGRNFTLVDSGGLELGGRAPMSERVSADALRAVGIADVVVFVFDGRAGLSDADQEAFAIVRETGCSLIVAVNKIDDPAMDVLAGEFYATGATRIFPVSAAHGRGVAELIEAIVAQLPAEQTSAAPAVSPGPILRLALVGRPNVGKSSLLNRLCGYERSIVDDAPGTTRDPVDVRLEAMGRTVVIVDTAGIRRPTRIEAALEHRSVARAIEVIRRGEVVLLVIDATEGVTDQDARLARLAETSDRALVLVCNKWDAAAKAGSRVTSFMRDLRERFPFLDYATVVFTSALTGDGVRDILPAAIKAGDSWRATFQTSMLNRTLGTALAAMDPPMVGRRRLNLMYVTQVASAPVRLRFFANLERDIPAHYVRFLGTRFRAALGLAGAPLRLEFRRTGRTWVGSGNKRADASSRTRRSGGNG